MEENSPDVTIPVSDLCNALAESRILYFDEKMVAQTLQRLYRAGLQEKGTQKVETISEGSTIRLSGIKCKLPVLQKDDCIELELNPLQIQMIDDLLAVLFERIDLGSERPLSGFVKSDTIVLTLCSLVHVFGLPVVRYLLAVDPSKFAAYTSQHGIGADQRLLSENNILDVFILLNYAWNNKITQLLAALGVANQKVGKIIFRKILYYQRLFYGENVALPFDKQQELYARSVNYAM